MAATADDFRAFANAGRELADLHVNYETVEPYPLEESPRPQLEPGRPRRLPRGEDGLRRTGPQPR